MPSLWTSDGTIDTCSYSLIDHQKPMRAWFQWLLKCQAQVKKRIRLLQRCPPKTQVRKWRGKHEASLHVQAGLEPDQLSSTSCLMALERLDPETLERQDESVIISRKKADGTAKQASIRCSRA
ncbi:unnamed protein product [Protopolystoma xenopodis]|uniref:Uncharacterized protein n=1 Tax=Protopolystoma xenopodis TaxID=117903 RepID=A0A448WVY6_9PLAT|nr:unnamed protein product [Protopolystoma xenopodis]